MAKPLKTAGAAELEAFRRRVMRQLAMERIKRADANKILNLITDIERLVSEMWEQGEEDYS